MTKPLPASEVEALEGDVAPSSGAALCTKISVREACLDDLASETSVHETLFSANPIPAVIYRTRDLRIVDANRSACELYGGNHTALCDSNFLDLFAPDTKSGRDSLTSDLRGTASPIGPFTHRRFDKRLLIVKIIVFPFVFKGADARVALVEDTTARLQAEEELRASEERFRELFENANDVIFIHDLKGRLIAINRAAEAITGYSRNEVLGKGLEELLAPEARSKTQDSIRAHLGGSATQHYELPILSKTGSQRFLDVSTRIVYRRGHPVAIQGIGRDITERKLAERKMLEYSRELLAKNSELSTALRLAKEATQLKEQFLANTSHELRTPMNGIMGMINLLKTTELKPEQNEYADAISQCANDLLTIINDLLDLSQIEAGRLGLDNEAFDPAESLRSVARMIALRASAKNLSLVLDMDSAIPAQICGDSVRFRQVLTNLMANAVKFTHTGGVQISLRALNDSRHMRCEVRDSGIGVDETVRERIFEAFFQADGTTRRRFGGTGLGLAISKQLVEIMGGRIGVYANEPPPGSTFWFELPFSRPEAHNDRSTGCRHNTAHSC